MVSCFREILWKHIIDNAKPLVVELWTGVQSAGRLGSGDVWGLILGLRPDNERRRYIMTPSLICWAQI